MTPSILFHLFSSAVRALFESSAKTPWVAVTVWGLADVPMDWGTHVRML
jgi:hypothetical protein